MQASNKPNELHTVSTGHLRKTPTKGKRPIMPIDLPNNEKMTNRHLGTTNAKNAII